MTQEVGYSIQGRGGQALWWADNAGGTPWSALAAYNFNLLPNAPAGWQAGVSGSFLLSTPCSVAAGQTLTVIATLMTAHSMPWFDVGFALLVQGAQVVDVLFALRPDGVNRQGDTGPTQPNMFAPPSPGVTVTPVVQGVANVVLGGINYGPPTDPGGGTVSTHITAVCSPPAGQYQLLFGIFATQNEVHADRPAALLVQYVDVR